MGRWGNCLSRFPSDESGMKTLLVTVCFAVVCVSGAADSVIRIRRDGTNVTQKPAAAFAANVLKLFESCSVDSTSYAVNANTWRDALRADSFVYMRLEKPVAFRIGGPVDEVLVPLAPGYPRHLFAKSGANVCAFTKYAPQALGRIALEPALGLSSTEPYASLAKLVEAGARPGN